MLEKIKEEIKKNKTDRLIEYSVVEESIPVYTVRCKFKGSLYEKEMEKHLTHENEIPRLVERIRSEMKKCGEENASADEE